MAKPSATRTWDRLLRLLFAEEEIDAVAQRIDNLLSEWSRQVGAAEAAPLGPEDVALITYGDTLSDGETPPLRTLHGFHSKYLRDVFGIVHILPFQPFSSDAGFSVIDYYAVREDLGDWDDVAAMAKDCRIMVDAVVNHISSQSDWFQGFLAGDPDYQDYFVECDPNEDLSAVVRPRTSPLLTAYRDAKGQERHIWTTFSADQIDLNYRSPNLLLAVLDVLCFLVSKGARLIRLDAVTFLWKAAGSTSVNLPETHAIIKLIRQVVSQLREDVVVITETNVPHRENIAYFGDGHDEAQMVYNFALPPLIAHSLITGNGRKLREWAASLELPSDQVCFFNFTASHDGVGVRPVEEILDDAERQGLANAAKAAGGLVSYRSTADGQELPYELNCTYLDLISRSDDDDQRLVQRFLVSQGIVLAMPGVPAVYIQSLLGTRNDLARVELTGRARSINRSRLDIDAIEAQLEDSGTLRSRVFAALSRLIRLRRVQPAFHPHAAFRILDYGDSVFAIERIASVGAQRLLCMFNLTDKSMQLESDDDIAGSDVLSGRDVSSSGIELGPYEILWLDVKKGGTAHELPQARQP